MTVGHIPAMLVSVLALAIGTGTATAEQFGALAGIDAEQMSPPELDEVTGKNMYFDYSSGLWRYYNYNGTNWIWSNNQWVTEAQWTSMMTNYIQYLNALIAQAQATRNSGFANQTNDIMIAHNERLNSIWLGN
jgi:hypothetical protein